MKIGSRLAILVFVVVALLHLLRLLGDIDLIIGTWNVPQWLSVLGVIGPGVIAGLLWKESK